MWKKALRLRDIISSFTGPLVWSLSLLPPMMLNAVTSGCAGLIIVFVFGFGIIGTKGLHPPPPVVPISDVPFPAASDPFEVRG